MADNMSRVDHIASEQMAAILSRESTNTSPLDWGSIATAAVDATVALDAELKRRGLVFEAKFEGCACPSCGKWEYFAVTECGSCGWRSDAMKQDGTTPGKWHAK